jgi:hypothetical protein
VVAKIIEIVDCDGVGCHREGARKWVIMSPDGEWREIDLCPEQHERSVANVFTLGRPLSRAEQPRRRRRAR